MTVLKAPGCLQASACGTLNPGRPAEPLSPRLRNPSTLPPRGTPQPGPPRNPSTRPPAEPLSPAPPQNPSAPACGTSRHPSSRPSALVSVRVHNQAGAI
jgi:hypothetical protein